MSQIINVSIDLNKIDKSKIVEIKRKDGTIGKFIDISVGINDETDKYGNICSISISQTKEERANKKPKIYLGNGKLVWSSNQENKPNQSNETNDSLPF